MVIKNNHGVAQAANFIPSSQSIVKLYKVKIVLSSLPDTNHQETYSLEDVMRSLDAQVPGGVTSAVPVSHIASSIPSLPQHDLIGYALRSVVSPGPHASANHNLMTSFSQDDVYMINSHSGIK